MILRASDPMLNKVLNVYRPVKHYERHEKSNAWIHKRILDSGNLQNDTWMTWVINRYVAIMIKCCSGAPLAETSKSTRASRLLIERVSVEVRIEEAGAMSVGGNRRPRRTYSCNEVSSVGGDGGRELQVDFGNSSVSVCKQVSKRPGI